MAAPARDRVLLAVTAVVQLAVLYAPTAPSAGGLPGVDKVVHAVVFGAVAAAARRCGLRAGPVAAVLVLHAVVSEVVQHALLPARGGDALDAVADVAGVALGLALARPYRSHRVTPREKVERA